ncbi:MAG: DUF2779 domain-containing protein [Bacteroidota bacterium]
MNKIFILSQLQSGLRKFMHTFQYSLHYLAEKDAELEHYAFLSETDGSDPRIALIGQLISETDRPGDIWVYNIGFEYLKGKHWSEVTPARQIHYTATLHLNSKRKRNNFIKFIFN